MKTELRLPTADPYAYIGLELDNNEELTDELIHEAVSNHNRAMRQIKGITGDGLPQRDWNKVLDTYREGAGISEETLSKLNKAQMWLIHEIDKSDQRINN